MANHMAIVAKVDKVIPIPGADKIQEVVVLGEHLVVSKDIQVGHVGILFPVDLQLSEEYCHNNNLFRDSTKNKDTTKRGFFDDNRRVRAQPFLKVKSTGYFAELDSLSYTTNASWEVGQSFDTINGIKICEKYISQQTKDKMSKQGNQQKKKIREWLSFDKHVDTDQFKYHAHKIEAGSIIYFQNKKHGTSFRVAKKQQAITLPKWKKVVNLHFPLFKEISDYTLVVGTRNVVIENEDKIGYNGPEGWRFSVAKEVEPYLENGMQVFGEIVGFANGSSIMPSGNVKALKDKRYTEKYGNTNIFHYGCKEHEFKFHIYRVTREDVNGNNIDMSQKELEQWCQDRNLPHTFEIHPPIFYDGDEEKLRELVDTLTEANLSEDKEFPSMIGEGVILRVENGTAVPDFYKNKSYAFRVLENLIEAEDMETLA